MNRHSRRAAEARSKAKARAVSEEAKVALGAILLSGLQPEVIRAMEALIRLRSAAPPRARRITFENAEKLGRLFAETCCFVDGDRPVYLGSRLALDAATRGFADAIRAAGEAVVIEITLEEGEALRDVGPRRTEGRWFLAAGFDRIGQGGYAIHWVHPLGDPDLGHVGALTTLASTLNVLGPVDIWGAPI
jgi:hypothetical protein